MLPPANRRTARSVEVFAPPAVYSIHTHMSYSDLCYDYCYDYYYYYYYY